MFLRYLWHAKGLHGTHSPFVFEFIKNVIKNKAPLSQDFLISRSKLLKNHDYVQITDFGAGSKHSKNKSRRVSDLVKTSGKNLNEYRILRNIVDFVKPDIVVELGTSLGLGTASLVLECKAPIFTFEGCPNLINLAKTNLENLGINHVSYITGNIDFTLQKFLNENQKPNSLYYIDANHTYGATKNYFNLIIKHIDDSSCIIFDDINWSSDMNKAWQEIKKHDSVTISIDLFHFGLIFFKKGIVKQGFILKYW